MCWPRLKWKRYRAGIISGTSCPLNADDVTLFGILKTNNKTSLTAFLHDTSSVNERLATHDGIVSMNKKAESDRTTSEARVEDLYEYMAQVTNKKLLEKAKKEQADM